MMILGAKQRYKSTFFSSPYLIDLFIYNFLCHRRFKRRTERHYCNHQTFKLLFHRKLHRRLLRRRSRREPSQNFSLFALKIDERNSLKSRVAFLLRSMPAIRQILALADENDGLPQSAVSGPDRRFAGDRSQRQRSCCSAR